MSFNVFACGSLKASCRLHEGRRASDCHASPPPAQRRLQNRACSSFSACNAIPLTSPQLGDPKLANKRMPKGCQKDAKNHGYPWMLYDAFLVR